MPTKHKDPAAVSLGRRGGKASAGKNLKAFMESLTPAQRTKHARAANRARWGPKRKRQGKKGAER